MTKDEALRLALEALETSMYPQQKQLQAITAIKAALEAKDEPVAYLPPTASPENACYTPPQPVIDKSAAKRIATALGWEPKRKSLREEMVKQMKLSCDSMEMRGAFADGWLSAEAAHGIKGEA